MYSLLMHRDWTTGGHWSLLVMTKSLEYSAPVFFHVDSQPSDARAQAVDMLIEEIKEHLKVVCYALIDDDVSRNGALFNLREESATLH